MDWSRIMAEKKQEFLCHQCFEHISSWYDIFTYNHLDEIPSKYKDDIETEDEFESLKNWLKTCNLDYIEDMPLGPVVRCCLKDCHLFLSVCKIKKLKLYPCLSS